MFKRDDKYHFVSILFSNLYLSIITLHIKFGKYSHFKQSALSLETLDFLNILSILI